MITHCHTVDQLLPVANTWIQGTPPQSFWWYLYPEVYLPTSAHNWVFQKAAHTLKVRVFFSTSATSVILWPSSVEASSSSGLFFSWLFHLLKVIVGLFSCIRVVLWMIYKWKWLTCITCSVYIYIYIYMHRAGRINKDSQSKPHSKHERIELKNARMDNFWH